METTQSEANNRKSKIAYGWFAVWILLIAILALVGIKLYQVTLGPKDTGAAPEFTLNTFDGETITMSSLRGKVVVVNIWASWCEPCKEEAPELEAFWQAYKDRGVMVLGVDYVDTEREARTYLLQYGITYPNGPDLGTQIYQDFRASGVPETYVIDQNGQIVTNIIGVVTGDQLTGIVEPLLE
jgi:cytochrome c biogenesis protein CcmG/thiol:disulfide interchange protein DsbE